MLFWSNHDALIIQILVGCILLLVIYLGVSIFMNSTDPETGAQSLSPQATLEIEKTLQKILENQGSLVKTVASVKAPSPNSEGTAPASAGVPAEEIAKFQQEISQREEKVKALEAEVQVLKSTASSGGGNSKELEQKVKDLEGRLSEYEIISEDIADLSFFKEENSRLQKEIESLKGGGPASQSAPPMPAPEVVAPPAEPTAPEPPAPQAVAPPMEPAPQAEQTPKDPNDPLAAPTASSTVDDDIMKEFAKAIEEQKTATTAAQPKPPVDGELMGKFEEFVKKN